MRKCAKCGKVGKKYYEFRATCTDCFLKQQQEYRRQNRKKRNALSRKRRALRVLVCEHYTPEDEAYTRSLFNHVCFNCGADSRLCIDHHYPISKGYALSRTNAVLLCKCCNSSKHNKLPEDYYTKEQLDKLNKLLMTNMCQNTRSQDNATLLE